VPLEVILNEMHLSNLGTAPIGTATLAHVEKHIGKVAATDVVVFAKRPWHFAGRLPAHPFQLRAHPQVHHDFPETILVLSISKKQQAVWWSETEFNITHVQPSGHPAHPGFIEASTVPPAYPFPIPAPIVAQREHHNSRDIFVARSGVPITTAKEHMFKISFTIGNETIDPDTYCSP
jgi:hypothetical protein